METKSLWLWNLGSIILEQSSKILPKYYALFHYMTNDECAIDDNKKQLCQQIVSLELFLNYFYSIYIVSLRGALRATNAKEQKANLKYVNAYIIEGYKALWGFTKHNQSLWGQFIKLYANVKNTEAFDKMLEEITCALKEYGDNTITDKDERCLAMHYQIDKNGNPQELLKLDEITIEKEQERYDQFRPIYHKMIDCFVKLIDYYLFKPYRTEILKIQPILPELNLMDQIVWHDKINEINFAITKNIEAQAKSFENCKEMLRKYPLVFKEISRKYKVDLSDCKELLKSTEAMLAISYFSLDLCSILKVYFNSTIPLERNIALSRMNIICHSIIDRVYGYRDRRGSYWEQYITKPYLNMELPDGVVKIRNVMESLIASNTYTQEKRSSFVHLKKDNYIQAITYLYSNNPLVEIQNSEAIIKILPEIQKAIVGVVKQVDSNIKCSYARKNSWIDENLKKVAPFKNQPGVKSVYESLLLLKKGKIMEAIEKLNDI
ncbi:hypothetical protein [Segatella hominis]|uniref:Uncharacterized protein n=1 Tax=Segatella hominis TaxID=2518605 RepID=A0A4Y8UYK1_9BACT|nr:hypothetical protein [Segatella hominis]TFH73886.1 hypothetical protein EXN75_15305 [Segatella hominis]